jgi:hypothetical protein
MDVRFFSQRITVVDSDSLKKLEKMADVFAMILDANITNLNEHGEAVTEAIESLGDIDEVIYHATSAFYLDYQLAHNQDGSKKTGLLELTVKYNEELLNQLKSNASFVKMQNAYRYSVSSINDSVKFRLFALVKRMLNETLPLVASNYFTSQYSTRYLVEILKANINSLNAPYKELSNKLLGMAADISNLYELGPQFLVDHPDAKKLVDDLLLAFNDEQYEAHIKIACQMQVGVGDNEADAQIYQGYVSDRKRKNDVILHSADNG